MGLKEELRTAPDEKTLDELYKHGVSTFKDASNSTKRKWATAVNTRLKEISKQAEQDAVVKKKKSKKSK